MSTDSSASTTQQKINSYLNTIYNSTDFITASDFTLLYNAYDTYSEPEDFTGIAHFTYGPGGTIILPELIITDITITVHEKIQMAKQLGETFHLSVYGKSPSTLTVKAKIPEGNEASNKQALVDAYKNTLRASATARTHIYPVLIIRNVAITGPLTSLELSFNSNEQGLWDASFTVQLMKLVVSNSSKNTSTDTGSTTSGASVVGVQSNVKTITSVIYDFTVGEDKYGFVLNPVTEEPPEGYERTNDGLSKKKEGNQ